MSSCTIDKVQVPFNIDSDWVFANPIPVVYKIENTKFPVNTEDAIEAILSVEDDDGFLKVSLVSSYESYQEQDWVELTDTSNPAYLGVWQILNVDIYGNLTLSVPYQGVTSGNVQRYYQNYFTILRLYVGIPPAHPKASENPMRLAATLYARPNSSNEALFNVSEIIREDYIFDNQFCQQQDNAGEAVNDLNAWVSVYVEYAESYDAVVDGEVVTEESTFQLDTSAGTEQMTNPDFASGSSGWSETVSGFDWTFSGGIAVAIFSNLSGSSKEIYQNISVIANETYLIQIDYNRPEVDQITAKLLIDGATVATQVEFSPAGSSSITYIYTPTSSATVQIGFKVEVDNTDVSGQEFELTLFSVKLEEINYYYLLNGTPQFGYVYGNNAGAYSLATGVVPAKFLTVFPQPRLFPGFPYDLSIIIPQSFFDDIYLTVFYRVKEYDFSGNQLSTDDINIPELGAGVYRLPISEYPYSSDGKYLTVGVYENRNSVETELSEVVRINIDRNGCAIHNTYISFLNYLGAWEYFLFKASRTNTFQTPVNQEIQRDVFANWDTLFAGGATQFDHIRKEGANKKTIYSQFVTKEERQVLIEWLRRSIKIMIYNEDAEDLNCLSVPFWRTILLESITESYTDIDKLFLLNFSYKETGEVFIQEQ